mgnify:FL=1
MFKINHETKKGIKVIRFWGDLTSDNMKIIDKDLIVDTEDIGNFIFDLKELELIDSTGLSYIINCLKTCMKYNTEIKLLNLQNQPKVIFEITRVNTLFKVYENETEALNSFKNKGSFYESDTTIKQQSA